MVIQYEFLLFSCRHYEVENMLLNVMPKMAEGTDQGKALESIRWLLRPFILLTWKVIASTVNRR